MEPINNTFGAALIGLIVGSSLYGITIIQTYVVTHSRSYNDDTRWIKSLVRAIPHSYLITNFDNPDNLDVTTWCASLPNHLCTGPLGSTAFQSVTTQPFAASGTNIVNFLSGLGVGKEARFVTQKSACLPSAPSRSLHSTIVTDILIAIAMCYYLYRKRTGLKRINTGLTTSIIGTICVVTFGAMPTNFVWLGFFWIMGKCYVNSFLALLNSRDSLRDRVTGVQLNHIGNPRSRSESTAITTLPRYVIEHESRRALRDKLLAALADLPGTRTFHVHVLTSSPRKHNGLFPYVRPRPRAYLQDVFILLSEQATPDAPRVLVTALEASIYHIPATASCVLYVSKVDASGHASAPAPTATLVRAFLTFYADPATRPLAVRTLWVQLFARAQGQYLFPNSAQWEGKRPLSDVRLCAWWRRIFGDVAAEVQRRLGGGGKVGLWYVLPGYGELEATHTLGRAFSGAEDNAAGRVQWKYGHPYSQTDIPLPCRGSQDAGETPHLGHFIPWFDDDPKSRFIDEVALITNSEGVRSPERKRPRASTGSGETRANREKEREEKEKSKDERPYPSGELAQVSADEFWERMSFRQECVAGAVTGFFSMGIHTPPAADVAADKTSQPSPLAPQPGQIAPRMVRRIVATLMNQHEFSTRERAVRATETLESAIKGLCEDDAPVLPAPAAAAASSSTPSEPERPRTPEPRSATPEPPRTPPPGRSHLSAGTGDGGLPDISPNPFPEPVASLETYTAYIYGSIDVRNAPLAPRAANGASADAKGGAGAAGGVTVLQVRKKRKPAAP
ncbi:histone acetylation protein-domain-containing protein [Lenzites betulinus]|nr:histone acetylation protein-domain-containing protein [Lenzites betulinus]